MVRFGHDGDDGENVDVAYRREVWATDQGGTDADEILALVGVFGDFEGEDLDAGDDLRGRKGVAGDW